MESHVAVGLCMTMCYHQLLTSRPSPLLRSPRKGLMSPKEFSNGHQTKQVFGFDAPFAGEYVHQQQNGGNSPNTKLTGVQQQTPPTVEEVGGGRDVSLDITNSVHPSKSARKSSPPINTPNHLKRHWPFSSSNQVTTPSIIHFLFVVSFIAHFLFVDLPSLLTSCLWKFALYGCLPCEINRSLPVLKSLVWVLLLTSCVDLPSLLTSCLWNCGLPCEINCSLHVHVLKLIAHFLFVKLLSV